jgi:S1-C subfamily serine protease
MDPPKGPPAAPSSEPRFTAWQVLGLGALVLALVAGACSGGLLIGFALGRATARPPVAALGPGPELPFPEVPDFPVPPAGRTYLGVRYVVVTRELARQEGLTVEEGALIRYVDPGSPALEASVMIGDVVTAVDGLPLDARHDLRDVLSTYTPGDEVQLTLVRGDRTLTVRATLGSAANRD